jgi:hypothetical protein
MVVSDRHREVDRDTSKFKPNTAQHNNDDSSDSDGEICVFFFGSKILVKIEKNRIGLRFP